MFKPVNILRLIFHLYFFKDNKYKRKSRDVYTVKQNNVPGNWKTFPYLFFKIKDFDNNFITSLELCYNYDPVKLKHHDICQNSTCNKQRLSLERSIFQSQGWISLSSMFSRVHVSFLNLSIYNNVANMWFRKS